jgi:hypothetical protein
MPVKIATVEGEFLYSIGDLADGTCSDSKDSSPFRKECCVSRFRRFGAVQPAQIASHIPLPKQTFRSVSIQKPTQKSKKARSANVKKLLDGSVRGQSPFIQDSDKLKR